MLRTSGSSTTTVRAVTRVRTRKRAISRDSFCTSSRSSATGIESRCCKRFEATRAFDSRGTVYYAGLGFNRTSPPNTVEVSRGTFSGGNGSAFSVTFNEYFCENLDHTTRPAAADRRQSCTLPNATSTPRLAGA